MRKKKLGDRALGGEDRLGAARSSRVVAGGGRGRRWLQLSQKEPSPGLGRSPAPSDDPGRLRWPPESPSNQLVDSRQAGPGTPGTPTTLSIRPVLRDQPGDQKSLPRSAARSGLLPVPRPSPSTRRFHLRGATVAELIGDGLDAPGPGHRDVAALGAHVQPHHRHDWLAARLRPGSGSASSGRCVRLPRGPTAPLSLGRPGLPGTAAARRGLTPRQAAPGNRGPLR